MYFQNFQMYIIFILYSSYRVIGPLQNFDEFSNAYNCPVGSYMNPVKKCVIW